MGSGGKKLPGYVNVDCNPHEEPDVLCDLGKDRWPFEDSSIEGAVCSHVLEHLTTEQLFHFLQELYRVCEPDASIEIFLPHPRHEIFLNDPTHQRPVTPGTIVLFSKAHVEGLAKKGAHLTPFYKYLGVNFDLLRVRFKFDPDYAQARGLNLSKDDPQLIWDMKHLNNVVMEWSGTMVARK